MVIDERSRLKPPWTFSKLYKIYSNTPGLLGERLLDILKWADARGVLIETKNTYPSFRLKGKHDKKIFSFWAPEGSNEKPGSFYCYVHRACHDDNVLEINKFVERLNELSLFNYNLDEVESGRNASRLLQDLTEAEYKRFKKILDDFCYSD